MFLHHDLYYLGTEQLLQPFNQFYLFLTIIPSFLNFALKFECSITIITNMNIIDMGMNCLMMGRAYFLNDHINLHKLFACKYSYFH